METAKATLLHYVIDSRVSRFTVQAFAAGVLSAMGHNPRIGIRSFNGEVDFNAETELAGGFRLSMRADSFSVLDDISDKDRREMDAMMKNDVLEIIRFPEINSRLAAISVTRLEATIFSATLSGNLSFHGVARTSLSLYASQIRRNDSGLRGLHPRNNLITGSSRSRSPEAL